jgi:hypothetical protein
MVLKLRIREPVRSAFDTTSCSPAERAQARGLDADVLHRAHVVARNDEVAEFERLVEKDREETKDVRQHVLRGERNRHAADAEAGDQRRDLDADVVQKQNQRERPDQNLCDARHPLDRELTALVFVLAQLAKEI